MTGEFSSRTIKWTVLLEILDSFGSSAQLIMLTEVVL